MSPTLRIGLNISSYDPFWVEVNEAIYQGAERLGITLIPLAATNLFLRRRPGKDAAALVDEALAQNLDAIIGWDFPENLALRVLDAGVPLLCNGEEISFEHPLLAKRAKGGLYSAALLLGRYIVERLDGRGHVLVAGGLMHQKQTGDGRGRIRGLGEIFQSHAQLYWSHLPTYWDYETAFSQICAALEVRSEPLDAIVGISDSIALAGRDAARALGRLGSQTLIAGINGDIPALAAISEGSFTVTVETSATDMGRQMIDLAHKAAQKLPFAKEIDFKRLRLVTSQNVTEVAAQKLMDTANLPNRLVGVQRYLEETNAQLKEEIAERAHSQEALRTSEACYRMLFNQIDDTVLIHDLEGRILDVNEAACQHLGYTRAELLQMTTAQIDSPEFDQEFDQRLRQQLNGGRLSNIQGVHVTRDGRHIDIGANSTTITYNGQTAILAVCRDITEQKRVERELRDLNRLKTEFLSTAAHELRTPLASLVGFSEILLTRDVEAGRAKQFMRLIHEQSVHLSKIIDSLLDIARLEAKQSMALNVQPVNLAELVTQIQTYFSESQAKYQFQNEGLSVCPEVMADSFRLGQVFQNLFSNAVKYSPEGGGITLRAQVIPGFIKISIQDQGIGMTDQQQMHLFERFYRADASNTTISGTGLGLAICKLIVELHGGQIWAASEFGVGTTIYFTLPLTTEPE